MKFYLGVTDNDWFTFLSKIAPQDVNFWQPGGNLTFKILQQGAPFVFKLKSPYNAIGGIGFFSSHTFFPINIAWDIFGNRNGCASLLQFKEMITQYRSEKTNSNPSIGCIVLTEPIFFRKEDWIDVAPYWSKSGIVQGKSFETGTILGNELWQKIDNVLQKYMQLSSSATAEDQLVLNDTEWPGYGSSILQKVRVGQGAFRVLVTDAYSRRCTISGEKTLPVLEAAHIRPYMEQGPHAISNGLLLRSDMHKLFDNGYITITKDYKVEVSKAIKEEFENGKEYYQYHGKDLLYLPTKTIDQPNTRFIEWHNQIFKG
ncbi:MAG: HNH endonuclease [Segetibacter sp.]|nr:HNH endonuclease [Segetibacter sp.]